MTDCAGLGALSWGLLDANVNLVTGYPGFHAHELVERCGGSFSINERTAYALAWGASLAGVRSAVAFKNVGLNDAADPFLNSLRLQTTAGMVVAVFDDVELAGSQCRQDSRHYFDLCPGLWLEPMTARHAYWCAREAPALSERFGMPVVIRVTNPLVHSHGRICRKLAAAPRRPFRRSPAQQVAHPVNAHQQAADADRRQQTVAGFVETLYKQPGLSSHPSLLLRVGAAALPGRQPRELVLWTYPLPNELLGRLLRQNHSIVVSELGSGFVRERLQALTSKVTVQGDDPAALIDHSHQYRVSTAFEPLFQALRSFPDRIVCGDLGSYTIDPDRTVDACLCYGGSVAVAIGCSLGGHPGPVFCVTGDAAFLHSGQACLEEGNRRGARVVVVILDNGGAISTGGQTIPGSIRIPPGLPAITVDHATTTAEFYRSLASRLIDYQRMTVLHVRC